MVQWSVRRQLARWFLVLVALGAVQQSGARERLERRFDWRSSAAPLFYISNLEQDDRGFLWIGTPGGLVRFDGTEMRAWVQDAGTIVPGSARAGRLAVLGYGGRARWIDPGGSRPVVGPDGAELQGVTVAAVSRDGVLYALRGDTLLRSDRAGSWSSAASPLAPGEAASVMRPDRDGDVLLAGTEGLWRIDASGTATRLGRFRRVVDLHRRADGALLIGVNDGAGRVLEDRDGAVTELYARPARLISMAERGATVWASYDVGLVALTPGEPPELLGPREGLSSGGPIWVGHEGSLWVGTFRGLVQYPEPDTAGWYSEFPEVARYIARSPDAVWMTGWGSLLRFDRSAGAWGGSRLLDGHFHAPCVDRQGHVWTFGGDLLEYAPGRGPIAHRLARPLANGRCSTGPDGVLWFTTNDGLYFKTETGPLVRARSQPFDAEPDPSVDAVLDDDGRLWTGQGGQVCSAAREEVLRGSARWVCGTLDGADEIVDLERVPDGGIWAACPRVGLFRFGQERWQHLTGSRELPSLWLEGLAPSPAGGVWVFGQGLVQRVLERREAPAGFEVVERLGAWHGLPTLNVKDLVEDPDGTLWLGGDASLVRVPAHARRGLAAPPRVELIAVLVDGERFPTDQVLQLPYRSNRLELRFSALSFRDPHAVRYRVRLHAGEPWSDPIEQPFFHFIDLPPGEYSAEVSATLDGVRWSQTDARFDFVVDRPWYRGAWFFGLCATVVAAALLVAHRVRTAQLLRLERQRARIAMDLHDSIGSGLGSIGILAGLASRERLPEPRRRQLASQIASIAAELGTSLSDLVWSLRPGSSGLEALATYLLERAGRMFPGDGTELRTDLPESWPAEPLSPFVRRNVQLIALEALHNAARHARATRVELALAPEGRRWRLTVRDDGRGIGNASGERVGSGMGLVNMRRRAAEIGAEIRLETGAEGGTVVSLVFDPREPDGRVARRGVTVRHAGAVRAAAAESHDRVTGIDGPRRGMMPQRRRS